MPTKVRQDRLGNVDIETTMGYTHAVSLDDQRAAAELERVIFGSKPPADRSVDARATWQIAGGNA